MLPDFPEIKSTLLKRVSGMARLEADQDPVLGRVQRYMLAEGDRILLRRQDGSEVVFDFSTPIETSVELATDAIRLGGPSTTQTAARQMSEQLNRQLMRRLLDSIDEATKEVGNVIDAKGKRFSGELYLEMLQKMELTFDAEGKWIRPTFYAGTAAAGQIQTTLLALEQDAGFISERDRIVEYQRKVWRAREANRRLAD